MLINKIKEQLMAEKIRPLHLPPTSTPSQQPLLVPTSSPDGSAQHGMSVPKPQPQQVPSHHTQPQGSGQPDIALHARPASSSGPGTVLTSSLDILVLDKVDFILCGTLRHDHNTECGLCQDTVYCSLIKMPSSDNFQMEIWTTSQQ